MQNLHQKRSKREVTFNFKETVNPNEFCCTEKWYQHVLQSTGLFFANKTIYIIWGFFLPPNQSKKWNAKPLNAEQDGKSTEKVLQLLSYRTRWKMNLSVNINVTLFFKVRLMFNSCQLWIRSQGSLFSSSMWSVTKGRKGSTKEYFFVWVTKMNGLLSYYGERRKLTQQCHLLEKLPNPSFSYLVQLFRFLFVGLLEEGLCLVLKTKVASNLWFSFPSLLHCGTSGMCYIPLLDQPSFFF